MQGYGPVIIVPSSLIEGDPDDCNDSLLHTSSSRRCRGGFMPHSRSRGRRTSSTEGRQCSQSAQSQCMTGCVTK